LLGAPPMASGRSRRDFLTLTTGATIALASGCAQAAPVRGPANGAASAPIPRRPFGKTGAQVSILGIGGSHLAETKDPADAARIVHEAIDAGINFMDNAWEYHDGKSEEVMGSALVGRRDQVFLMTKVCTHGRGADVAMQQLEESLRRLRTDHLDLWQVHECVYDNDPSRHYARGGVIEAIDRAKKQGKVRFVGFTGHKHPDIHLEMMSLGYAFDSVQMPLNCFDATFRSFEQRVVPEALKRGLACIGMKSLTGHGLPIEKGIVTAEEALRYAMSVRGVAVTVSGIDGLDVLHQNLAVARGFVPMSDEEMTKLRQRVAEAAADGHLELYKTTTHFDAGVGREQHGYPAKAELPL
jgi:aryl-alcohol dehydrogenase-like predicted oxidoreductase